MTNFADAVTQMRVAGMPDFPAGHPIIGAGKITRYGPRKNAWYVLNEFAAKGGTRVVVGAYGMWGKIESAKIEVDWKEISTEEREELRAKQRAAEEAEREKRGRQAELAANRARDQWSKALTIDAAAAAGVTSAYLTAKAITPETVRLQQDGTVLVPMIRYNDADGGRMVGLQKIGPDGTKRFNKGMAKEGAACRLGPPPEDGKAFLLCEGYATGRSIRMATMGMYPVFVCFDAGNLAPVATILRSRYPSSPMLFCADDDWKTEIPEGSPFNVGVKKARAAAHQVGRAEIVVPVFPNAAEREDKWTDFNDLAQVHGRDGASGLVRVGAQIEASVIALMLTTHAESISTPPATDVEVNGAAHDFGGDGGPPDAPPLGNSGPPGEPPTPAWRDGLQRSNNGSLKPSLHNAFLFFTNDDEWAGVLGWDLFAESVMKLKPPPFEGGAVGEWNELDDHRALLWLSRRIGEPGGDTVVKAVLLASHRNEFNKLKDHLESVEWDGVHRVKMWLIEWCHAMKTRKFRSMSQEEKDRMLQYLEKVGTKWLVAAIARVYEPGCRVDNMLILESEGGFMKSTLFRELGGEWFTDARLNFQDKDSLLILQGRWIVEMPELEGMNKSDASETKRFMTQHIDLFRPPYGRRLIKAPRRCILGGSVNHDQYLKDDSGNRRMWPVEVGGVVDIVEFKKIVPQLWAEALVMYHAGVKWWVEPAEKYLFEEQQEDRYQQDAWEPIIADYLDGAGDWASVTGKLNQSSVQLVLQYCLKLDMARRDQMAARRVASVFKRLAWSRRRAPKLAGDTGPARQWFYFRPQEDSPAQADGQPDSNPTEESEDAPF